MKLRQTFLEFILIKMAQAMIDKLKLQKLQTRNVAIQTGNRKFPF